MAACKDSTALTYVDLQYIYPLHIVCRHRLSYGCKCELPFVELIHLRTAADALGVKMYAGHCCDHVGLLGIQGEVVRVHFAVRRTLQHGSLEANVAAGAQAVDDAFLVTEQMISGAHPFSCTRKQRSDMHFAACEGLTQEYMLAVVE